MPSPRKVEVVTYNSRWPDIFRQEAGRIQQALGTSVAAIYHIGSTAIPDMPAKPVIDIMLAVNDLDEMDAITEKLLTINYTQPRRQIIPHYSFITSRQENDISFHLHIHERGSTQIARHVNFRDYVIQHPDSAIQYAALKLELASRHQYDIFSYVRGKDSLVQEIDTKAKLWAQRKQDYPAANTGPLAKNWPQEKIMKAMATNLNVHMTHFAQYLNQVELIRIPGFTLVNSGLPDESFNCVLDADFPAADAEKKIQEITHYFTDRNLPFAWWISPFDQPENLAEYLQASGYRCAESHTAMYVDLDAWHDNSIAPPELKIVCAKDQKTLQDFALVLTNDAAAFTKYYSWIAAILTDDDPFEYYVGYVNNKPVVRGLICYFAGVAGLYWLSTAPDERNKGYAAAMQHFRLRRARELGYHLAVLQASSESHALNLKSGFKECGVFHTYTI